MAGGILSHAVKRSNLILLRGPYVGTTKLVTRHLVTGGYPRQRRCEYERIWHADCHRPTPSNNSVGGRDPNTWREQDAATPYAVVTE
jgi:hypothetical protein